MALNPEQFYIEHEEHSPLENTYPGMSQIRRLVVRHPDVTPTEYPLAETTNTVMGGRGSKGKTRKVKTPGAGPNAAGMVDYETSGGGDGVYIRYIKSGVPNEGIPRRAVDAIVEKHNPTGINFGKIITPRVVDVMRSASQRHPNISVYGHRDFGRDNGGFGPIKFSGGKEVE